MLDRRIRIRDLFVILCFNSILCWLIESVFQRIFCNMSRSAQWLVFWRVSSGPIHSDAGWSEDRGQ